MRVLKFLLMMLSLVINIYGWGAMGHRIIAGLAMDKLNEDASQWVSEMLEGGKLQDISNWADEIRSDDTPWSKSIAKWHIYNFELDSDFENLNAESQSIDWPKNLFEALQNL